MKTSQALSQRLRFATDVFLQPVDKTEMITQLVNFERKNVDSANNYIKFI